MTLRVNPLAFGAAVQPKNKKPQRWPIQPDQTAMPWFWRHATLAVPFWEGGGLPRDLVEGERAAEFDFVPNWQVRPVGLAFKDLSEFGNGNRITFTPRAFPVRPFAILLMANFENGNNRIVWEANANTGFSVQTLDDATLKLFCNINGFGSGNRMEASNSPVDPADGEVHTALFRFGSAVADAVYIDGRDQTAATTTNSPDYGSVTVYDLFNRSGLSSSFQFRGPMVLAAIIEGEVSNPIAVNLTRDPFAPFRPRIEATLPLAGVEAAAGANIEVIGHYYRSLLQGSRL